MSTSHAVPAAPRRLDSLQVLRAAAAGAVLIHHAMQQANGAAHPFAPKWLTTSGAAGVDVFFVISGFIMTWIAFGGAAPAPRPGRFLIDRLTRILPLYWLCCFAMLVVAGAGFLRSLDISPASVFASLALLPHGSRLLGVAWTLEYELYFYLVFAIWLPLGRAGPCLAATAATIAAAVLCAPLLPPGSVRAFLGEPIALEFAAGMGIGWLALTRPAMPRIPGWVPVIAWAALLLSPLFIPHETTDGLRGFPRLLAWGLPAWVIVAHAVFLPPAPMRSRLGQMAVGLGNASYALYLTHGFVMIGYAALLKRSALGHYPQGPVLLLMVAGSCILALVAHRLAERPLTRLARVLLIAPCRTGASPVFVRRQSVPDPALPHGSG